MTDTQSGVFHVKQSDYVFTEEELKAKAAALGIDAAQLDVPEFPDFRDTKGYKLKVTAAKNCTSPRGASQVELSVVALDEEDRPVPYARGRLWISYPFDSEQFKFKDADQRERSYNDLSAILRGSGDARFEEYSRKIVDGAKTHYFDIQGNELDKSSFGHYKRMVRINRLTEMRAREQDATKWLGATFFAQRKLSEKDGQVYKNWQHLSPQPKATIDYIFSGPQMLSRNHSEDVLKDPEGHDLF